MTNPPSPLTCPRCSSSCTEPVPGIARCRWCRRHGDLAHAKEYLNEMNNTLRITNVRFTAAADGDFLDGLIGYVSVEVNHGLRLDGLTVRRTAAGRLMVSFPERRDGAGRRHALIWPLSDGVKREIESAVLEVVRGEGSLGT